MFKGATYPGPESEMMGGGKATLEPRLHLGMVAAEAGRTGYITVGIVFQWLDRHLPAIRADHNDREPTPSEELARFSADAIPLDGAMPIYVDILASVHTEVKVH